MDRRNFLGAGVAAMAAAVTSRKLSTSRTVVVAIYDGKPNILNTTTDIESVSYADVVPVHCIKQARENDIEDDPGPEIGKARLERDGDRILAHIRFDRDPHLNPAYPCIWGNCSISVDDAGITHRQNLEIERIVFEPTGNVDQRIQPL